MVRGAAAQASRLRQNLNNNFTNIIVTPIILGDSYNLEALFWVLAEVEKTHSWIGAIDVVYFEKASPRDVIGVHMSVHNKQ